MVGFSLLVLLLCVVVIVFPASASPSPPLEQAALVPIEFPVKTSGSDTGAKMALGAHNVESVGQIGGVTYAVALRGNYAYIGVGPRLVIFDVSIRAHTTFVGQTGVLPDLVRGVAVGRKYAYVADGSSGLRIVEISDPSNPTQVGTHDTPGVAHGAAVEGDYTYVATGSGVVCVSWMSPIRPPRPRWASMIRPEMPVPWH